MDCRLLGSSVHGISQARILEWVAISLPRGSSWPKDQTSISWLGRQILYSWATRYLKHILWIVFFCGYQILLQLLSKTEELWSLLITHSYSCIHTHTSNTHTSIIFWQADICVVWITEWSLNYVIWQDLGPFFNLSGIFCLSAWSDMKWSDDSHSVMSSSATP